MGTQTLRIGHLSTTYHTALVLRGTGWLERMLKTRVEWHMSPTGPDIVRAFARDEVDIGFIGLTPAMIGIGQGIPITCVAGGHVEGTIVVAASAYASLSELGGDLRACLGQFEGRRIGCPKRGSIHDIILRHYLAENGLEHTVGVSNFDTAELLAEAMLDGVVEAGVATPCLSCYLRLCAPFFPSKIAVPASALWPHNPSYGIFVSSTMIRKRSAIIESLLMAHKMATAYIRQRPQSASRIVANLVGLVDETYILEGYKISPKYCVALSPEYVASALSFVTPLRALGYLARELEEEDVFESRFVEKIHPEPAHYESRPRWSDG